MKVVRFVVFDVFGNRDSAWAKRGLAPGGTYATTVPSKRVFFDAARTRFSRQRAKLVILRARRADLDEVSRLASSGALRPIIDRVLDLGDVAHAHAHLETRRARGKVVLSAV